MKSKITKSKIIKNKIISNKLIFTSIALLLLSLFSLGCKPSPEALNQFALCISENGAEMYGADWCSHCQDQKQRFGEAFKNVNYIDCDIYPQKCASAGIEGFPTWKFKDGTLLPGVQEFSVLSFKTGCKLD